MRVPPYNFKQVLLRAFIAAKDALRVFISNTSADPIPVEIVSGGGSTTATIFNIALGPVNTEQSQALPANTKSFVIKTRGNSELKLAYDAGDSGTTYIEIKKNAVFSDENLYVSQTLYFQSPSTGDTVEIVAYT